MGFVNTKSELSPRSLRRKASLEKSQLKENAGKRRLKNHDLFSFLHLIG